MQALAQTSSDVLKQLLEERDTGVQLESGLQLLLQLQMHWPTGLGPHTTQTACCLNSYIAAKVSILALHA